MELHPYRAPIRDVFSVFSNVAFGLRASALPAGIVTGRVEAILDLLKKLPEK